MDSNSQEYEQDKMTIRRLQATIDETYPRGWVVAIDDGKIVADSADFHELEGMLRALGKEPRDTLVVEAGAVRPEYVTIFI
jgi:hypothetical protein